MLDTMSVAELRTGVEVRRACRVGPVCLLPLFGVLCKELAVDWLTLAKSLSGTLLDSSVACDETVSEVTFSAGVFLGFLFLVF